MTPKEELASIDAEIERLDNRKRELYALSIAAPAHEKICDNYLAELLAEGGLFKDLALPIEVTGIHFTGRTAIENGYPKRKLVRIQPCAEEYSGKTFLGLYLGDLARTMGVSYNPETGVLEAYLSHHNPAIWIPSLERIVFGFESWWGPIESEEQLRAITTETIDSVWYVQAMKALVTGSKEQHAKG